MKGILKISAWEYGLAIVSVANFISLKKEHKIKASKMLTYFSKNNDIGNKFADRGAIIPIHHIDNDEYSIFYGDSISSTKLLDEWKIVAHWGYYNLNIQGDKAFWIMQLSEIEKWKDNNFSNVDSIDEKVFVDGVARTEYIAIKIPYNEGMYKVKIYGLKNIQNVENYGFYIEIIPTVELGATKDATETDFSVMFE